MVEILPIRLLTEEDGQIFGSLNVALGKLDRAGLPVGAGTVVTAPEFKLKTILEHFDFGSKEVFEQSLTLVKKEIAKVSVPEILQKEVEKHKHFLVNGLVVNSQKELWQLLLNIWLEEIKVRLWKDGFYKGLTEELDPQIVIFLKKLTALGSAYFDPIQDDVVINIKQGKLHPNDSHKLYEIVKQANKKLFISHEYEWIEDGGIKLTKVLPFTPLPNVTGQVVTSSLSAKEDIKKSVVKVFFDLSTGFTIEKEIDGVYIASEKIFDLNKPQDSFENLVFRLVESALTFPNSPVFFKLADVSEGMGKLRGTLRLLHQKSLLEPLIDALSFVKDKKGLNNIQLVIPYVRSVAELSKIKKVLTVKKLWLEAAVPENIINLEDYLALGLDGVVLNLDELISYLNGFDSSLQELLAYKNEVKGLLKFLEDGLKILHKSKIPFIAYGSLALYPEVLEYLVGKGVYGVVVEKYEAPSAKDLLHQTETRIILRKTQ